MKLELNATVIEPEDPSEPRRMTLWWSTEDGKDGSKPVLSAAMTDDETETAAALRAVEMLFADAAYDIGGEIDDLRGEIDDLRNHEHGRMT